MRSRGEEVLLPTSTVGAHPRPHWLRGRVIGTLNEPTDRSFDLRVAEMVRAELREESA